MSATQFKPGDTVYDESGNVYSFIGLSAGVGFIVEPCIEDDEDAYFGEPTNLMRVYSKPPRQKLAEDLSGINAEIQSLTDRLNQLHEEVHRAEQQKRTILAHAKANPQLADLYLWLEGKATHLVALDHYSVTVGPINDMLSSRDKGRMLRLLSLVVDPQEHRYSVRVAAYSDGSGNSWTSCRLASSEEHAREIAREYITKMLSDPNQAGWRTRWIEIAIHYGVPVTEKQRAELEAEQKKRRADALTHARNEHARTARNLAEAEAAVNAEGGAA